MAFDLQEIMDVWNLAVTNYGEAVVTHLLDLGVGERPTVTDIKRQEVLQQLAAPLGIREDSLSPEQRTSLRCHLLTRVLPQTGLTYLETVRRYVGGKSPAITGDELVDTFSRLVFNGLAMELVPGAEWDRVSISAAFQDPVLINPAAAAFLNDEDLTRLFPDADSSPDERGSITATSILTWLPGGGGTTDLRILIGNFVEQTLARMRFFDALTEELIGTYVRDSIEQIRRFARREEVDVLVLTGLLGIQVDEPLDRNNWGIRTAQGLAIKDIPPRGRSRPKSILWKRVPHRLLSCDRADLSEDQVTEIFDELWKEGREFHSALRRRTMTLRFGILAWSLNRDDHPRVNILARILHGKSVDRVADMSQPASRSRHDESSRVLGTALMYDSFLTMGAGKERQKQKNGAKGTTADVRMVPDVAGGPAPRAATTATARPDPPVESTDEHAG